MTFKRETKKVRDSVDFLGKRPYYPRKILARKRTTFFADIKFKTKENAEKSIKRDITLDDEDLKTSKTLTALKQQTNRVTC